MSRYAVIGFPLHHSFSPDIHNPAFKHLGLNCYYDKIEIKPDVFTSTIEKLKQTDIRGFNVTIPYKKDIIPFLDDTDDLAEKINAVNTVKNINGHWKGFNTDVAGFIKPVSDKLDDFKNVLIIGAGGAANAVSFALLKYSNIEKLTIANRTLENAEMLVEHLIKHSSVAITATPLNMIKNQGTRFDLIINTSSAGMGKLIDVNPLNIKPFIKSQTIVYDLIYNPSLTLFLKQAEKLGLKIINGLPMLIGQAKESFKIWTGREYPAEISITDILSEKYNLKY